MQKETRCIKTLKTLALFLVLFAAPVLVRLVESGAIIGSQLGFLVLDAGLLTAFLVWIVPKLTLSRRSLILLIWLEILVVEFLNNYVEGYFFTTRYSNPAVLAQSVTSALISSVITAMAAAILLGRGISGLTASLKKHLSTRTVGSWILRIVVGSVAYFPIYFFFGMLIAPFVLPYYSNPSYGLRIPSFAVMIPVEFFRGFVYTMILLPLLAVMREGRTTRFIALAATLYIPGGLIPLLSGTSLPTPIIPFHALEILADSIVYGFVLSRILGKPPNIT